MNRRYVSSADVARHAGVSQSAVSRTFPPGASVAPATREKVLEAARTLGYRPNFLPQALMSNRSRLVAVAVGGVTNPFYAAVLQQFAAALQHAGQQVMLIQLDSDYALDSVLDRIAGYRVDALVSALAVLSEDTAQALSALRIPVVCFNGHISGAWLSSVTGDNRRSGCAAANHLRDAGAHHLAFVEGPRHSPASVDRRTGFVQRLRRLRAPPAALLPGDYSYESGFEAAGRLLALDPRPAGVACANDLMALGVLDGLRRAGLGVPEQVRVLGWDNIGMAAWANYGLTSFDQDVPEMIRRSLRLILDDDAQTDPSQGVIETVPARLVVRSSTARS